MCATVVSRLQLESRALVQSLECMHSKRQFLFSQLMAKWKIGKGGKKNLFRLIETHQFSCEEIFYLPIFFYSLENVKETHHLNIYIFSWFFFQLKLFTEFTESLRERIWKLLHLKTRLLVDLFSFTSLMSLWKLPYKNLKCLNSLYLHFSYWLLTQYKDIDVSCSVFISSYNRYGSLQ